MNNICILYSYISKRNSQIEIKYKVNFNVLDMLKSMYSNCKK